MFVLFNSNLLGEPRAENITLATYEYFDGILTTPFWSSILAIGLMLIVLILIWAYFRFIHRDKWRCML
jgi:hypothetical protein